MTIANDLLNEFQGNALIAIENEIDEIAESFEDDFSKGERIYKFVDESVLIMKEDYLYLPK